MANQPIKKKFDYEKNFSNELKGLLTYIGTEVASDISFTSLTFDIFFIAALEQKDSMLYKAINGFLTSSSIDELHDSVHSLISDGASPVRPGRTIEYSQEMKNLFVISNDIKDEIKAKAITSDMVFLAFMRTAPKKDQIKKLILEAGINEDTALELVKKMRDTVSAISDMTTEQFEDFADRFMTGVDLGSGESQTAIAIVGSGQIGLNEFESIINELFDGKKKPKKEKSNIEYCESLNSLAEKGGIEPLIGREKEIFEITKVLSRKMCNNVVIVGETGVGKTAIINGLASKIVDGSAPLLLKDAEIFKLDVAEIASGTQFRGQFEQRVLSIIKNLKKLKSPILFIDNIHNFVNERKNAEFDIFGELEPVFSDKKVMVIVATTPKGFHSAFETNSETMRKFQRINVESVSNEECFEILSGLRESFEKFHNVKYSDEILKTSISLAERYITDRKLPSSALDIIDEAGALRKMEHYEPESVYVKRNKIALLKRRKDNLIKEDNIQDAKDADFEINGLTIDIADALDKVSSLEAPDVTLDDLYRSVSEHTGIPVSKVSVSEKQQLSKINSILMSNIIGQDEAIDVVCRGIKRNKIGLSGQNRPILSCMCIGNTGCGKTLLAKMLAKEIFGDEKYLVRFDMSEYSDRTAVNKLIGASAGYVGYNEGGLLTEAIKNKKHAVLLIDEIEKATDEIFNLFLQILDEGFLTDNTGIKVDFKNVILILTSNIGAKRAANEKAIGFFTDNSGNKRDIIEKELKNRFPPEFLNRLDEIVYFNELTDENLKQIINLELDKLSKRMEEVNNPVVFDNDVADFIFKKIEGEKEYGARPIGRAIRKEIENAITDYILENDCESKHLKISVEGEKIKVSQF